MAAWQLWVNPPEPWVVVACSPQSAAVDVTHHTGPLTDVSPGMLGWSVLQRRQTPEALEAGGEKLALPILHTGHGHRARGTGLAVVVEAPDSAPQNCTRVFGSQGSSAFALLVPASSFGNSAVLCGCN